MTRKGLKKDSRPGYMGGHYAPLKSFYGHSRNNPARPPWNSPAMHQKDGNKATYSTMTRTQSDIGDPPTWFRWVVQVQVAQYVGPDSIF